MVVGGWEVSGVEEARRSDESLESYDHSLVECKRTVVDHVADFCGELRDGLF